MECFDKICVWYPFIGFSKKKKKWTKNSIVIESLESVVKNVASITLTKKIQLYHGIWCRVIYFSFPNFLADKEKNDTPFDHVPRQQRPNISLFTALVEPVFPTYGISQD